MQINLVDVVWIVLIVFLVFGVVALFQLILILFDLRQVTKTIKNVVFKLNLLDWCFDGEEIKKLAKRIRKAIVSLTEFVLDSLRGLFKGGEKNG